MSKQISVGLIFLLWQAGTAWSQTSIASLGAAWMQALQHNPNQQIYVLRAEQAGRDYKTSLSYRYPTVTANFNGQYNLELAQTPVPGEFFGQPGTTVYTQFGKKYNYSTGFNLQYAAFDWQAKLQSDIAKINIQLAESQRVAFEQTLKEQVAQLYYTALLAKAAITLGVQDASIADSLVQTAEQRLAEGVTNATTVNQAKINRNNVQQTLAANRHLYAQSLENLKFQLGVAREDSLALTEVLPTKIAANLTPLLGEDKTLLEASKHLEISLLNTRLAKAAYLPKLSFYGYLGWQQFSDELSFSLKGDDWRANQYVGLNVNIPIFSGFSKSHHYQSALVQQNIASTQYQNAARQSSVNDKLLMQDYNNSLKLVNISLDNYHLFEDNLHLARQRYEEGFTNLDAWLSAFEDFLRAENQYLSNLSQLLTNQALLLSR